jgi:hypothetical protein
MFIEFFESVREEAVQKKHKVACWQCSIKKAAFPPSSYCLGNEVFNTRAEALPENALVRAFDDSVTHEQAFA